MSQLEGESTTYTTWKIILLWDQRCVIKPKTMGVPKPRNPISNCSPTSQCNVGLFHYNLYTYLDSTSMYTSLYFHHHPSLSIFVLCFSGRPHSPPYHLVITKWSTLYHLLFCLWLYLLPFSLCIQNSLSFFHLCILISNQLFHFK